MDWKDDILRSLEGMKRAAPQESLYPFIQTKIYASKRLQLVRRPYVAMAAACLTILITANIWAVRGQNRLSALPSVDQVELANFDFYY